MKYVEPWSTQLAHFNVADLVDLGALRDEIFNLHCLTEGDDPGQKWITSEFVPEIIRMRDELITPRVIQYAKELWDYDIPKIEVETSGKWIPEGEGLFPHVHGGSCISTIFYPSPTNFGLSFFDPRSNAGRGYPKEIRDRFFKAFPIVPAAGDIWIFPSYLQHSVSHVQENVRLSMLCEYYLRENV
jgi:hypothetical protein